MSNMLQLAIKSSIPLIHVSTDDVLNVGAVLGHYAGREIRYMQVPKTIPDPQALKKPEIDLYYTFHECESLMVLYPWCQQMGVTIIFVNTEKSNLQLDCGVLVAPRELVLDTLTDMMDPQDAEEVLPSLGGLTLKDVSEVAVMTATRDGNITARGITRTRKAYISPLRGIQQIDTELKFYKEPVALSKWLKVNASFFLNPVDPALVPRGLLFDGPPGTGKTMGAKYIADYLGLPLYHLDMSAMRGRYVGDSEGNLMAALQQVDQVSPCVVLLDEVEKVFQAQGDSGVSSSMLSQMLWWLQEHKTKVFTVMTTNNRMAIPPELFREGRIDETMTFNGLEGLSQANEFAKMHYESMIKGLFEPEASDYKALAKAVQVIMGNNEAIAQVKVVKMVNDIIKETLNSLAEEVEPLDVPEGAEAGEAETQEAS